MKVGDLVIIVQSDSDSLVSPFVDEVGVIVAAQLEHFKEQDSFSVLMRDRVAVFGENYLRVLDESR